MTESLVSVIMAVRNGERFLRHAIDSILQQTYRPLEIVLIDGQSTDGTAAIARSYPEVRYIHQESLGVAKAYNLGVESSAGGLIAFLSHDDTWPPEKLSLQAGYLREHPEVDCVVARVKFFLEPGCSFPPSLRESILEGDHPLRIPETLLARRRVFGRVGLFDPEIPAAEDMDWFARAADLGVAIAVIDKVLLRKRIHDRNTSVQTDKNMQSMFELLRRSSSRKRKSESAQEPRPAVNPDAGKSSR
ncbi:MAG: glycosyltransferase [Anaerolineales bacterium]|nr:glycosyltransferase [Anaerolineales bacterium]